jgi:hypothetical protein
MPTSNESLLDWRRLPTGRLLQVRASSKLGALAAHLEKRYGSAQPTIGQPASILSSAAAKLVAHNGDLAWLSHRERKAAIELCWARFGEWEPDSAYVRRWLDWAEAEWNSRIGASRVAISYVRNFDPAVEATRIVGDWLALRSDQISGPFGEFFRRRALHDGRTSIGNISLSLASGNLDFLSEVGHDMRTLVIVRGSGFLVSIVAAYGRLCESGAVVEVGAVARALLGYLGDNGLGGKGSRAFRDVARIAMITGIVKWASRSGESDAIGLAIEICLSLAGDPRQSMALWRGIPAEVLNNVEAWLTARTIDNLFRVIDELRTDQPQQWQARRAFWRSYLPYIKRAYLVCGAHAQLIADQLKEPYGILQTSDARHCGVLMQLVGHNGEKLVVLEVNKNAGALFWNPGTEHAPEFYNKGAYNRQSYLRTCDERKSHLSSWPRRFADFIEGQTGIRRPNAVNQIV